MGRLLRSAPLQAAAAMALFTGGLVAGLQFTGDAPLAEDAPTMAVTTPATSGDLPVALPASDADPAYMNALAEIETLRSPLRQVNLSRADGSFDAIAVAELMRRLDAAIEASREAVERSPENPLANATLFQLVDYRSELANRLDQSTHLTRSEVW